MTRLIAPLHRPSSLGRRPSRATRVGRRTLGRWVRRPVAGRARGADRERGDVPGWVLITIMTAGLVIAIWALAGPQLEAVFNEAISRILGANP